MAASLDTSRFPLVIVSLSGSFSDAAFDEYLQSLARASFERKEQSVVLFDATHAGMATATQRKKHASWMNANEEPIKEYVLGCAFVIRSSIIRGVLTAILWLHPLPSAYVVLEAFDEAENWAILKLASVGLRVPPPSALRSRAV
jgi:hypothetical protein